MPWSGAATGMEPTAAMHKPTRQALPQAPYVFVVVEDGVIAPIYAVFHAATASRPPTP